MSLRNFMAVHPTCTFGKTEWSYPRDAQAAALLSYEKPWKPAVTRPRPIQTQPSQTVFGMLASRTFNVSAHVIQPYDAPRHGRSSPAYEHIPFEGWIKYRVPLQ